MKKTKIETYKSISLFPSQHFFGCYVDSCTLFPFQKETRMCTPNDNKIENILFTFLMYSFPGQENSQSEPWVT